MRVQPRARRNEIAGERNGVVLIRVTAPALEDRANVAACKLVAKLLGVAPSRIEIVRGARSRDKVLRVQGVDAAQVRELLGLQG